MRRLQGGTLIPVTERVCRQFTCVHVEGSEGPRQDPTT